MRREGLHASHPQGGERERAFRESIDRCCLGPLRQDEEGKALFSGTFERRRRILQHVWSIARALLVLLLAESARLHTRTLYPIARENCTASINGKKAWKAKLALFERNFQCVNGSKWGAKKEAISYLSAGRAKTRREKV